MRTDSRTGNQPSLTHAVQVIQATTSVFLREDGSLDFDSDKRGRAVRMGSELWARLNGVAGAEDSNARNLTALRQVGRRLFAWCRGTECAEAAACLPRLATLTAAASAAPVCAIQPEGSC